MYYDDEPVTRNDVESMVYDRLSTLRNDFDDNMYNFLANNLGIIAEEVYEAGDSDRPSKHDKFKISLLLCGDIISQCTLEV